MGIVIWLVATTSIGAAIGFFGFASPIIGAVIGFIIGLICLCVGGEALAGGVDLGLDAFDD